MSGNVRLRALVIVVVALAVIWFIGDRYGMRAKDRSYRDAVLRIDTAEVIALGVVPGRVSRTPWRLERGRDAWRIVSPDDTFRVEREAVLELLAPLAHMKVKRQVGTMDLVKDRYELGDTTAERLLITLRDGSSQELLVGKSTFSPKGPWSHVNVPGEKEVFVIDGMLSMATEKSVPEWRPRTVVSGVPAEWARLHFVFPGNDYSLVRGPGGTWSVDALEGDSARINKYLGSMAVSEAHFVAVGERVEGLPETHRLEITRSTGAPPIVVRVFATPDGRNLLHSTCNPDNVLWFDPQRETPRLFRPMANWLKGSTPVGPPM
ncbi:MAG: DUF4340 domain-containing protein [Flavobacteriales bacterium]|nr:DUF4340 domain-containing protein [Flavobacteriales bacterium]